MIRTVRNTISLICLIFFATSTFAQPAIESGKTLFRNYCAQCHAKDMKTVSTGPPLLGFEERWAEYPREDLYGWVKNSQALVASGHPRAVELWDEYRPALMNPHPNLTDEDIESIFLYIADASIEKAPIAVPGPEVGLVEKSDSSYLYYVLFAVLLLFALFLSRVIGSLNEVAAAKEGIDYKRKTYWEILTSKKVVSILIFLFILIGGYTTVTRAINFGRQQNYSPEQPIKFSHETHAGIHKIDCQYCHDGARRSKHAVIPATNTCMNCHKAIAIGSEHGTTEISKIYASIGFDPNTNLYIENYGEIDEDEIKTIFKRWFAKNFIADNGNEAFIEEGEEAITAQWDEIVNSLTNEQKKTVRGPIEWIRTHNLPDYVYFNHSQHVIVGEIECQTCHGPVEDMKDMYQHSPLSMGWCINCHRETEVQFEGNEYYTTYTNYHEELSRGERSKVTVHDIGGLECQKCHY